MSSLPPPAPPPPAPPAPPSQQQTISSPAQEWDWDRVRDLAERWYRPLLHSDGWLALAYLLLGMVTGIAFFVVINVVGWTTFGLLFAGIGFLLVGVFFRIVDKLAGVERRLAGIIDVEIPPRSVKPIKGLGLRAVLDVERWRQLAYLAINMPLADRAVHRSDRSRIRWCCGSCSTSATGARCSRSIRSSASRRGRSPRSPWVRRPGWSCSSPGSRSRSQHGSSGPTGWPPPNAASRRSPRSARTSSTPSPVSDAESNATCTTACSNSSLRSASTSGWPSTTSTATLIVPAS